MFGVQCEETTPRRRRRGRRNPTDMCPNLRGVVIRRTRIVKFALFFFNIFLTMFSLAVVVFCIAILCGLVSPALGLWKTDQWSFAPWALFISGAVMLVVACFGCAVVTERHWIVVTYTIFLVVILVMQLALAGLMFNHADSMLKVIGEEMHIIFNNSWSAVRDDEHMSTLTKFYTMQHELKCCGMSGATDYEITGSVILPESCCAHASGNSTCTSFNAYNVGCTVLTGALYFEWNKTVANVTTSVLCVLGALSVLLFILFMDVYMGGEVRNPPLELSEHGSTIDDTIDETPYFLRRCNDNS